MGRWPLWLSAKILALFRLSANFFQLRLIVNLKIIFVKKQKQTRERSEICRGETFIITEMAVFTPEKYYSREPCYPLDDSRQIGNTS